MATVCPKIETIQSTPRRSERLASKKKVDYREIEDKEMCEKPLVDKNVATFMKRITHEIPREFQEDDDIDVSFLYLILLKLQNERWIFKWGFTNRSPGKRFVEHNRKYCVDADLTKDNVIIPYVIFKCMNGAKHEKN